jgi:hypothetical protein
MNRLFPELTPHSAVFFENSGDKSFYIIEIIKSSSLAIRPISDIAKMANANCGMWDSLTANARF